MSFEWKSKVIVTQGYTNIGAARVLADYTGSLSDLSELEDYNAAALAYNAATRLLTDQFGCVNGPAGFTNGTGAKVYAPGGFNTIGFNRGAANLVQRQIATDSINRITFRMWANGQEQMSATIISDDVFRLPTGYKADTFEFSVSGNARTKAIHFGETPYSLRDT